MAMQLAINMVLFLILAFVQSGVLLCSCGAVTTNASTRPNVVNIGAFFTFSSVVGKVAKVAVEAAVEDVNSDPSVLGGTKLHLTTHDTKYSGFLGIVEGKSYRKTSFCPSFYASDLFLPTKWQNYVFFSIWL